MLIRNLQRALRPPFTSICIQCSHRDFAGRSQARLLSTKNSQGDAVDKVIKDVVAAKKRQLKRRTRKAPTTTAAKANATTRKNTASSGVAEGEEGSGVFKDKKYSPKSKTKEKPDTMFTSAMDGALIGSLSLKDAMLRKASPPDPAPKRAKASRGPSMSKQTMSMFDTLPVEELSANNLHFEPVERSIPPIPMLSHGLDRVLFNPGVYRLQDPRSRVFNFDPYLEKIMPATEFDFNALAEYQTSSKDTTLLDMTRELGTKFTGSTSSLSSVLSHFHFLLSNFRPLNHDHLSRKFPDPSNAFSKIQQGPSAIFLRWKNGVYAVDPDKSFDTPNIMSWLGHSLEKLLTSTPTEFEQYRKSNRVVTKSEDQSHRCFHYTQLGNFLIRSQLDAYDPRLPGTGVFDLKTRAVVSIRMDHEKYEEGSGYQIRYSQGLWESYERELYDMSRATLLKYSLQARMGRMDGIFVAYHNIERLFGFQYLTLADMDRVLHGQEDTSLGDQEFKLSVRLLDDILQQATEKFPNTSIRLHFQAHGRKQMRSKSEDDSIGKVQTQLSWMSIFAEPMSEELIESIQNTKSESFKIFEREHVGVRRDDPEMQAEWHSIQEAIDEAVDKDEEDGMEESKEAGDVKSAVKSAKEEDLEDDEEIEEEIEGLEGKEDIDDSPIPEGVEIFHADAESAESKILDAEDSDDVPKVHNQDESTPSSTTEPGSPVPNTSWQDAPLIGWTLSARHRVNGRYEERPTNFSSSDHWTIEYVMKEMEPDACRRNYEKIKDTRKALLEKDNEEQSKSLARYRAEIAQWSAKGRMWRKEQDRIDEEMGVRTYVPLGPGSDEYGKEEDVTKDV